MKISQLHFLPWRQIYRWSLGVLSYLALAGTWVSLVWLSLRLESLPNVELSPWDGRLPPLVVVDAGHGGHDGGAVAGGVIEKDLALNLALQLREQLKKEGLRVRLSREDDVFIPLAERAALASRMNADALISLHLNTSPSVEVSGIETYYSERRHLEQQRQVESSPAALLSQRLAESLQQQVCQTTQATDRGARARNYVVVSEADCPAALVECGFLTHAGECARLLDPAYQQRLIAGLARGVQEFLHTRSAAQTPLTASAEERGQK